MVSFPAQFLSVRSPTYITGRRPQYRAANSVSGTTWATLKLNVESSISSQPSRAHLHPVSDLAQGRKGQELWVTAVVNTLMQVGVQCPELFVWTPHHPRLTLDFNERESWGKRGRERRGKSTNYIPTEERKDARCMCSALNSFTFDTVRRVFFAAGGVFIISADWGMCAHSPGRTPARGKPDLWHCLRSSWHHSARWQTEAEGVKCRH